jgi:hypothetical protein
MYLSCFWHVLCMETSQTYAVSMLTLQVMVMLLEVGKDIYESLIKKIVYIWRRIAYKE